MSESCSKRHVLIMMTLTPKKKYRPCQVLFEKTPTSQLIVRVEKKNKQKHFNSLYQFHGEIDVSSVQHAISSGTAIDYKLRQNIGGFRFKKIFVITSRDLKHSLEVRLPRPPLKSPQTFQNINFQWHSYSKDKKKKNPDFTF